MSIFTSLQRRPMLIGGLVLALFAGSLYLAFVAGRGLPGQKHTLVTANFADVGALRPGDDVREGSLRIGQVRSVDYVDGKAQVVLQLEHGHEVYQDATATVWSRSALGQKFIELDSGSKKAGEMDEDDVIPAQRTGPPNELDTVFNALDARTRKQVATLLREGGGGMAGHTSDLQDFLSSSPDLLRDLGTVSRTVNHDEAQLVAMLRNTRNLSARFAGRQREISDLLAQMDTTLRGVDVDEGQALADTLHVAPRALKRTRGGLDALNRPLRRTESAMRALRPGARALAAATPDLRAALRQSVGPLRKVPGVSQLAEPSMEDLTTVATEAGPLAPELGRTLADARPLVQTLAPYAPEITRFFLVFGDALADGDKAGHWLRLNVLANTESVDGVLPMRDPLTKRNPYPEPGEAVQDRKGGQ